MIMTKVSDFYWPPRLAPTYKSLSENDLHQLLCRVQTVVILSVTIIVRVMRRNILRLNGRSRNPVYFNGLWKLESQYHDQIPTKLGEIASSFYLPHWFE